MPYRKDGERGGRVRWHGPLQGQPPTGAASYSVAPAGAAAYSTTPVGATTYNAVPARVATYSATLSHSDDRLRAQRPWAGLRTRWQREAAPLAYRGCRPRAATPDYGQRRPLAVRSMRAEGEGYSILLIKE
ncbi:hypothetical protein B296_00026962 [Ensete ventricosum]|uniref:Uncharacterized protein n=1 Tax=Ensete ventricosum TaxID=4639 RepID=A0A427ADP4_ENSVE|nr:hypothetical protein B296_00026962 [Ensete ventricosum]